MLNWETKWCYMYQNWTLFYYLWLGITTLWHLLNMKKKNNNNLWGCNELKLWRFSTDKKCSVFQGITSPGYFYLILIQGSNFYGCVNSWERFHQLLLNYYNSGKHSIPLLFKSFFKRSEHVFHFMVSNTEQNGSNWEHTWAND